MPVKLPNVLKDANVYIDGQDFLGKGEIEIPKVAHKAVEYQTMGMSGSVELPLPGITEKMEGKIKFKSYDKNAAKRLYDGSIAFQVEAWGSVQEYNSATARMDEFPAKVVMRAFFKEVDLSPWKQGQEEAGEATYSAVYFKLEINGEEVVEIDPFAYIYKVNGKDLLEQTKANIGLK